jgi:hypothetical protein
MRKVVQLSFATALCGMVACAGAANAATLVLSGPNYSANLIWNNDGTVSLGSSPSTEYTAVEQQSELFSGFTSGSSLAAGSTVALSYSHVGGVDHHTISFLAPFGSIGGAFDWGYTVGEVSGYDTAEGKMSASLLQNNGIATLSSVAVDAGSESYTIDFTQTDTTVSGITKVSFADVDQLLVVSEHLTIDPTGSDVTGVSNSFVEKAIPEVSTWGMVLFGFAVLGFTGYRRNKIASVAA